MSDPRLALVETLIAMAEFKDVPSVAAALGVSVTTVPRDIEQLEDWAGRILLLDGQLTTDGERFAREAVSVWSFADFVHERPGRARGHGWALLRSARSNVRLSDLKAFSVLAGGDVASYRSAADHLSSEQSTLRKQIEKLEVLLDSDLFRGRGDLLKTDTGRKLHPIASSLISYFNQLSIYADDTARSTAQLAGYLHRIRDNLALNLHNAGVFIDECERTKRLSLKNKVELRKAKDLSLKWKIAIEEIDRHLTQRSPVAPFHGEMPDKLRQPASYGQKDDNGEEGERMCLDELANEDQPKKAERLTGRDEQAIGQPGEQ
ncbi:hypothetical protein [Sphingomonas sp. VNH70]|uniref:helix-turn-helix domain-containing protein n=1 Tax=Sphingomonas silueang TaxID=3156617 RepID=UPI0032B37309